MPSQLRIYKVRSGAMEDFVALWRDHIVPAREAHGFTVEGVWNNDDEGDFVWIVHHDDFEAADERYYASPERAAVPVDPATYLEGSDIRMIDRL
jgi:hypothetical protein